jgi:hypothetical protein
LEADTIGNITRAGHGRSRGGRAELRPEDILALSEAQAAHPEERIPPDGAQVREFVPADERPIVTGLGAMARRSWVRGTRASSVGRVERER